MPQGLGGRLWPGEEAAAEGSSLGGREALSPHAFSLVCDRVGRRVSPAMQPLLARAEALPAPSLPDSANSKDGFRNTPAGREPRQRLARHPRLASTPPAGWGATAGQLANGPLTQMYGLKGAPARPQNGPPRPLGGLEGDLGRLGKDPSAWIASAPATGGPDPAQTLGVPRVSRSAGLPAVPRGPRRAPRAGGQAGGRAWAERCAPLAAPRLS